MDVNASTGTEEVTVGGSSTLTSGTATFSGDIVLRNLVASAEEQILNVTSSTNIGAGITFSGGISEENAGSDTLHITKSGSGKVTFTGANTYRGNTLVTAGTLNLGTGGSVDDTPWIRVDSGATFGTPAAGYTTDAVVSGSGVIQGNLTVGSNVGAVNGIGVMKPGDSTGGLFANAGDMVGTLTVNGDLTLAAAAGGATRLEMQLGAAGAADANDSANILTRYGDGTYASWVVDDTDGHLTAWEAGSGSHDRLNISGSLDLTSTGQISITNPDSYTFMHGDVFDLFDWNTLNLGTFDLGGMNRDGGLIGDLYLPTLTAGLTYDLTIFASHGIIVVVPEPSRGILLMLSCAAVLLRRRRRQSARATVVPPSLEI